MMSLGEYFLGRESRIKSELHHTHNEQHFLGAGLQKREEARIHGLNEYVRSLYVNNTLLAGSTLGVVLLDDPRKYWLLLLPLCSEAYRFFSRKSYQADQQSSIDVFLQRDVRKKK